VPHLAALPGLERLLVLERQLSDADAARLQELAGRPIEVVREDPMGGAHKSQDPG
jgi:hypothetical protein